MSVPVSVPISVLVSGFVPVSTWGAFPISVLVPVTSLAHAVVFG